MKKILRIALSLALVIAAFVLAIYFSTHQGSAVWYSDLVKPDYVPSIALVQVIWVFQFLLLAVSLARVCGLVMSDKCRRWFFAFAAQLALNVLWVLFFFVFHALFFSMVTGIVLWFIVLILTLNAAEIDRISFWLLVPYIAWITFATVIAVEIWWWN